jgi:hypothetical protein
MTIVRAALTLIVAACVAACLPVSSKVPAGSTVGFKPDPVLLGVWKGRGENDDNPAYLHFIGNDDGSMTAIIVSPPRKQNLGEWSAYSLRVARLGANHIVNARELSDNGKPAEGPTAEQNILLMYRVGKGGKVTLYIMDDKAAAAAIKAGEIAGEVEPGQDGDVHITADTAALDAFLKTPRAAALFSKPLVTLTRVE